MADPQSGTHENSVHIDTLHEAHPAIRAEDWRSPLVARLLDDGQYADGNCGLDVSYRPAMGAAANSHVRLVWSGLASDYKRCLNTYQDPQLTEFAALAVACILCASKAGLQITEVTRRGEKVDFWLGDRALLLEVSGTKAGNLDTLCTEKATEQLQVNPFGRDGFVCVTRFVGREARLWFYAFPVAGA